LVKWLFAVPLYVVLLFLGIAEVFAVVFAWFAILFTAWRLRRGAGGGAPISQPLWPPRSEGEDDELLEPMQGPSVSDRMTRRRVFGFMCWVA
jgi:hypothetical protein